MAYQDYLQNQDPSLAALQTSGLPTYGPNATINSGVLTPPTNNLANQVSYPKDVPIANTTGLDTTTASVPIPPPLSSAEQSVQDLIKQTQGLNTDVAGEQAYRTQQEQTQGLPELQKTQNDLRAQQQAILNDQTAIQLNQPTAGQGGVSSVIANSTYGAKLRDNAIKALGISSLLAASQGNVSYAQSLVDRAVEQQFGPKKAQIEANLKNLDLIIKSPEYTNAEKARAQAQIDIQNAKAKAMAQAEQDHKDIWSVATTAASNGKNFVANGQYTTLALALDAISKASTKEAALSIASATGLVAQPKATVDYNSAPVEIPINGVMHKVIIDTRTNAIIKDYGAVPKTSSTDTKQVDYTKANQFLGDNPTQSYDVLRNTLLQNTALNSTEVDAFLASKGIQNTKAISVPATIIGNIEALKSKNATLKEITDYITFSGYHLTDPQIADVIKGYTPTSNPTVLQNIGAWWNNLWH